jgi:type II secretory pathway pseudopilin PulG
MSQNRCFNDHLPARRLRSPQETRRIAGGGAFTVVELVLALTIISILGTAVVTMLMGASQSDNYLSNCLTAQSETDLAIRRIINNIREAQTGSIVLGPSTLATLTQPDNPDGFPVGVAVSYAVQPDPSNASQNVLQETDQRWGTNTLVHNVTTFSVTAVSGIPNLYQVDLVVGSPVTSERHVQVFGRN